MSKRRISKIKREIKNFWLFASLAGVLLLSGAVFQLNSHIHKTSLLAGLEKQLADVSSENNVLENRLSQSNSLENFNEYQVAQSQNYERVNISGVYYVRAAAEEFAKK